MTDALYRLLAWLSPAYPIGGFSYSHGIETAVEEGFVINRVSLVAWIQTVLGDGTGRVDGALFAAAWRAADARNWPAFDAVAERAAAWRGTSEIALESRQQGGSFLSITRTAWPQPDEWMALLATSLLAIGAQLLLTFSLRWVDAMTVGVISQLAVIVSMFLGAQFLQETITPMAALGAALTIGGVVGVVYVTSLAKRVVAAEEVAPEA